MSMYYVYLLDEHGDIDGQRLMEATSDRAIIEGVRRLLMAEPRHSGSHIWAYRQVARLDRNSELLDDGDDEDAPVFPGLGDLGRRLDPGSRGRRSAKPGP
jgi:hypothetical protein